jgi:hypothetical protein
VDLCAKVHDAKLGREKGMHMAKRVADLLVEVLLEAGVQRMYGVSGDSLNGITDAVSIMASATSFCFCMTQKHLTIERTRPSRDSAIILSGRKWPMR